MTTTNTAAKTTAALPHPNAQACASGTPVSRGARIASALAFIALGVLAIVEPVVVGLTVTVVLGVLLIVGGGIHAVEGFDRGCSSVRRLMMALLAMLYAASGLYLVGRPLVGLGSLTLLLTAILLTEAVLRIVTFGRARRERGSAWMLMHAAVNVVLAMMIWSRWPSSSAWAIGTMVGVNLLMTGVSQLALSRGRARA